MPPVNAALTSDERYRFWSRMTARQAHNKGWPRERVSRRVVHCFKSVCEQVEPTLSVELGAHQASFSTWVKQTFPDSRSIAVEANPYVYEQHAAELAEAGVDYRHVAAAAESGEVTLHIPTSVRGKEKRRTNRMASLGIHQKSDANEAVTVPAVRGDDLAPFSSDDRVVVWIDVEGAARQVLAGSPKLLAQAAAVFVEVESESTWEGQWLDLDVARYFDELGKVPVARDIERPHQYNVVFLDAELAASDEAVERIAEVLAPHRGGAA